MWVVPTIHPAALLRDQTMQWAVKHDLAKAVRIHKEGVTRVPKCYRAGGLGHMPEWSIFPALHDVEKFMERWRGQLLSCDFESTFQGKVMCLGMWPVEEIWEEQGLCVPFAVRGGGPYWNPGEEVAVKQLVFGMLQDETWPKVGQNWVGFDEQLAKSAWGITVRGTIGDCMVAHHLVMPELPHSLAFQSSICTDLGPYKLEVHETEEKDDSNKFENITDYDERKLRTYCLEDCIAGGAAWRDLREAMA